MTQKEFLEQKIFTGLENQNNGFDKPEVYYFNETDFATVLERAKYFGLSIYDMSTALDGEVLGKITHEDAKKKATDFRWYTKTFENVKKGQSGLVYAATYKVSAKLLAKN